jgi:hypothetical protein
MKAENLKVGQWYSINYKDPKHPEDNWAGKAKFVQADPPDYAAGALEFVCEDGNYGVFGIGDVVDVISDSKIKTVTVQIEVITDGPESDGAVESFVDQILLKGIAAHSRTGFKTQSLLTKEIRDGNINQN